MDDSQVNGHLKMVALSQEYLQTAFSLSLSVWSTNSWVFFGTFSFWFWEAGGPATMSFSSNLAVLFRILIMSPPPRNNLLQWIEKTLHNFTFHSIEIDQNSTVTFISRLVMRSAWGLRYHLCANTSCYFMCLHWYVFFVHVSLHICVCMCFSCYYAVIYHNILNHMP